MSMISSSIPDDYFNVVFPLIKNAQLWFKTRSTVPGQQGGDVETWVGHAEPIEVYMEPYSSAMAKKEYGLEIECQKRIFCPPDPNILQGLGVYLEDREGKPDFILESVMDWPRHLECLLK
ncbi:hypothetical protein ACE3MQ_19800 [Paenibacillus lentus]|uniref:hypothetical protein n=1 Tax=Paenibacillus lentus TaxID=1338368 RepID=UPI003669F05A